MACRIESQGNIIKIVGSFQLDQLWRASATLHNLTTRLGYANIVLDFSGCTGAMPAPMLGLCAEAGALRERDVDVDLRLPEDPRIARVFVNSNWAHEIDPNNHKRSSYKGYRNLPAARFATHEDQSTVVNRMVESILCSIDGIERGDLAAIEWALNEITDNVLVHSLCATGGLAQITNFARHPRVEFSVSDAGVGIPETLRGRFERLSDSELLERATKEGVTRDPALGQGNGLFGTFSVANANNGTFHILSGHGMLAYSRGELRLSNERAPFPGTLVVATMDCSNPRALAEALRFGDIAYHPLDYIETRYEDRAEDRLIFRMHEETLSCGSRVAGTPVRQKLLNLTRMNPGRRIAVDMSQVPLLSSSFADEVFGKLFKILGPLAFGAALDMRDVGAIARGLIDKAIAQRMSSAAGD